MSRRVGLTVGDVIAMLETFDPAAPLLVSGEYGGFEEVVGFRKVPVMLDVNNAEGFGPHERAEVGQRADTVAVTLRTATHK